MLGLTLYSSKFGLWTSNISITWELVRDANFLNILCRWSLGKTILTSSPRWFWCSSKFKSCQYGKSLADGCYLTISKSGTVLSYDFFFFPTEAIVLECYVEAPNFQMLVTSLYFVENIEWTKQDTRLFHRVQVWLMDNIWMKLPMLSMTKMKRNDMANV